MVMDKQRWIPPLDYVFVNTEFYNEDVFFQYCTCVYYIVNVMVGNEIGPRGELQLLFLALLLMLSAFINANIFGLISMLIQQMNHRSSKFQEKVDNAGLTMKNLSIPRDLQNKVQSYLLYTRSTHDQQKDVDSFLNLLSPSLKVDIQQYIFADTMTKSKVFEGKKEIMEHIVSDLKIMRLTPEDQICREGTIGNNIYFVITGICIVSILDEFVRNLNAGMSHFVEYLGDYFGEISLLKNCKRTASVRCKNYVT